jgi:hypothetical protein
MLALAEHVVKVAHRSLSGRLIKVVRVKEMIKVKVGCGKSRFNDIVRVICGG